MLSMNIDTKIQNAIQNKMNITLKEEDCKGKGQFGDVYLHEIENQQLAVKYFQNEGDFSAIKEDKIIKQIQSIAKDCPGILKYYGMKKLDIKIEKKIKMLNQNQQGNCLFMQLCHSNLQEIDKFQNNEIFNFLSQMSLSLFCLHVNGCSHSDLKPANILFNVNEKSQFQYYLTDFGVSKILEAKLNTYDYEQTVAGTPLYFAPEILAIFREQYKKGMKLKIKGKYNPLAADIFSLGLICLEKLIGKDYVKKLNKADDKEDEYNQELETIKTQLLKFPEFQQNSQNKILNLLLNMISFDKKQRPQAIEICQKLIEAKEFTMDMLEVNSMKALIAQFILAFKPKKTLQKEQNIQNFCNIKDQQQTINQEQKIQINLQSIAMPTFESDILKNSNYSSIILSLFDDSNVKLSKIHSQNNITKFDINMFHSCCDNKGSTLVIMHSNSEPNTFFGGMAISSWESPDEADLASDPAEQSSWLFKIELEGEQLNLHQWKCIKKDHAIWCSQNYGPYFGLELLLGSDGYSSSYGSSDSSYLIIDDDYSESQLPSNNTYYKKQDLTNKLKDQKNLLFSLNKKISIKCPSTVIGKIMNEAYTKFQLSECEVFTVKQ